MSGTAVPESCTKCKTPLGAYVFYVEGGAAYCPRCIIMEALRASNDPQAIIRDAEALVERGHRRLDLVQKVKALEQDRAEANVILTSCAPLTSLARRVWEDALVNIDHDLDQVHHQLAQFDADRLDNSGGYGG